MGWTKHREARDVYAIDFGAELAAGEALSNPVVRVLPGSSGTGSDVTAEFVDGPAAVQGTQVIITLKAAAAGQQGAGDYRVFAFATVGAGRVVATAEPVSLVVAG